jgi:hypothetical protein
MNKNFDFALFVSQRWLSVVCLFTLALAGCGIFPSVSAAPVDVVFDTPQETIEGGVRLNPVENQWDGYGEVIDLRGDVLAIGASEWNQCGAGSVHLYRLVEGTWQKEAHLLASDRDEFKIQARQFEAMRFGTSVALGEGIIAVGAPGNVPTEDGGLPGAVYLYEYDGHTWAETAKLTPGNRLEGTPSRLTPSVCTRFRPSSFGSLLALDGNTLVVGGDAGGLVYVYERGENSWTEQARVQIPEVEGKMLYMASVSLFGDTLALSVYYILHQDEQQDSLPVLSGNVTVYVFEWTGDAWEESFQFSPKEEAELLFFREVNVGASVALGGESEQANLLAIGLPGFPDWSEVREHALFGAGNPDQTPVFPASNRQTGAVYLFERAGDDWRGQTTLKPAGWETPPGPGAFPSFPTHLEEGQENSDETGSGFSSSADLSDFVFPGVLWSEKPEITFFGATVDLDGDQLAVTAGFANATYVFENKDGEWVYRLSVKPTNEKMELWEDFAQVVKISGPTLLLGTPGEFGNSAYVFDLCDPSLLGCK